MLRNLDRDFVDAIFAKYGRDVKSLNLSQNGLQKLHNIEAFDKLVKLNLSCNDIREIGPLASLHNLVELNLEQNEM
jgi:Leucine-rich repeat (LRR) protein